MAKLIIFLIVVAAVVFVIVYVFWGGDGEDNIAQADLNLESMLIPASELNTTTPPMSNLPNENLSQKIMEKSATQPPQSIELDENKTYTAHLKTTNGDIKIELNTKQTPATAYNFIYLTRLGFYDDTIFHRVIKGFMIQGGDPKGDGTGGPSYRFADESFEGEYSRGVVAMANSGPNTNGSQFFIMHQDYTLPPNYVIFGKVVGGMDVVDKIATATVDTNFSGESSVPINPVKIKSVEIMEQ